MITQFTALFRRRERDNPVSSPAVKLMFAAAGLLVLYMLAATAGYLWIHYVMKNEAIGFTDVVLVRWKDVRREVATQQFAKAKVAWEAKNYQPAYLAYVSGLRNDPENIDGRLAAARFLLEVGSVPSAIKALEEGFARNPDHQLLSERLFELLISTGRDRRALELLQGRFASGVPDRAIPALRTFELQATLNAEGAVAARQLLGRHPELDKTTESLPVVAQVWWETQDRLKAIELLAKYVRGKADNYSAYVRLVGWYLAASITDQAQETAEMACAKFPGEIAPRVLLIEAIAARTNRGREWTEAIQTYLGDFGGRPESITQLAMLAGRKGWSELARSLYGFGTTRQYDLRMLAFAYSDALAVNKKFKEALETLSQIESQSSEGRPAFIQQLRQRQVLVAAALGDSANVREFSRRLVAALRNDPHQLELTRRIFEKKGIVAALPEFTGRSVASTAAPHR